MRISRVWESIKLCSFFLWLSQAVCCHEDEHSEFEEDRGSDLKFYAVREAIDGKEAADSQQSHWTSY
jgi:hypothetical protein